MNMRALLRWPGASAAVLGLLGLAQRCPAQAVQYNTGRYASAGSTYHTTGFSKSGTVTNTGAFATTNTFAASSVAFTNLGTYATATGGANPVTDQFTGASAQELASSVAPQFDNHALLRHQVAGVPDTQVIALDAAPLPAGIYLLRVQQNGHAGTVRVVRR